MAKKKAESKKVIYSIEMYDPIGNAPLSEIPYSNQVFTEDLRESHLFGYCGMYKNVQIKRLLQDV